MSPPTIVYELVSALAAVDGVEPTEMGYSLADFIDPDIVEGVASLGDPQSQLTFTVPNHTVAVTGAGQIIIDDFVSWGGETVKLLGLSRAPQMIEAQGWKFNTIEFDSGPVCLDGNLLDSTNTFPDLCFLFDRDGVYQDVITKPDKADLLYDDAGHLLDHAMDELLPAEIAAQIQHNLVATMDSAECRSFEYELPVMKGTREFAARTIPVEADDRAILTVRDITEAWLDNERMHN